MDTVCALFNVYYYRPSRTMFYFAETANAALHPPRVELLRYMPGKPISWGKTYLWRPLVVQRRVPELRARVHRQPAVLLQSLWPGNFGHALGDDMLRAARLMRQFGVQPDDTPAPHVYWITAPCVRENNPAPCSMHELLWPAFFNEGTMRDLDLVRNETITADELERALADTSSDAWMRFDTVLAGSGRLGVYDQDNQMGLVREHAIWKMGGESLWRRYAEPVAEDAQRVLVIRKNGRRAIQNSEEIEHTLRDVLGRLNVGLDVTSNDDLANMSLHEQVCVCVPMCVWGC